MRKALLVALVLVGVFLIGFLPERAKARRAWKENSRLELELGLARLQGQLGMISYEANRNNFANAAAHSTNFFNALKKVLPDPLLSQEAKRKSDLEAILARRDEITADLARADPAVKDELADMYVQLSGAVAAAP